MKLKTLIITSTLFLTLSTPVLAQSPLNQDPHNFYNYVNNLEKRQALEVQNKTQRQQTDLANLKKRVDKAIDNRINVLNRLLQRVQNDTRLSSDEKANLSSDIQADIAGLTTLKAKIDADTTAADVRTDAKQIVTNFRIYAVVVPKERLLIIIDNLQAVVSTISNFTPKIQDLINTLQSQGKDVSTLQNLLNDVNSKLTSAGNQLVSDKNLVLGVTVSTTDPKSVFTQVRKDLADVRQTFAQIRHDFGQMRETFRIIITGGNSGNGSASVSPVPSATPSPTPTSTP